MTRRGINPKINALSTIMFIVVLGLLLIINKRSSGNGSDGSSADETAKLSNLI
jgi:spermidine/putrescine transport system permease protein